MSSERRNWYTKLWLFPLVQLLIIEALSCSQLYIGCDVFDLTLLCLSGFRSVLV